MINGKPGEKLETAVNLLRSLAEKYPVYYANGNHEHRIKLYPATYGDAAERYGEALAKLGISPMVNSHVQLPGINLTIYGSEIGRYYYKRFTVQKRTLGDKSPLPRKGIRTMPPCTWPASTRSAPHRAYLGK